MSSHVSPQPSLVVDAAESKICTVVPQEKAVNKDISTSHGGFGTVAIPHYSGARLAHNKRNGNRLDPKRQIKRPGYEAGAGFVISFV